MLLLETLVVPYATPWLGVNKSQRIGSMVEIPIYILFPILSRAANNDGLPVFLASVALLVICYAGSNAVGDFYGPRALFFRDSTNTLTHIMPICLPCYQFMAPDGQRCWRGVHAEFTDVVVAVSVVVGESLDTNK